MGVVGGSGSGKTTLGMSLLRLLPPAMSMTGGQIIFDGEDIAQCTGEHLRRLRGGKIGMVFQEPLSAFDPLFTISQQMDETLRAHTTFTANERRDRIEQTLRDVELDDPRRIARSFPHELSGGLRQRAMIALSIVTSPQMIIADEATSSLDVTIQAKIIKLLRKLNCERGMTILLISHDLGLVGHLADDIAVMSSGRIVEQGNTAKILSAPVHSYTQSLIEAF